MPTFRITVDSGLYSFREALVFRVKKLGRDTTAYVTVEVGFGKKQGDRSLRNRY